MAVRPAARQNQNPNTVLVIFLIFFILASIGLGFGTYSGYAAEDNKEAKIATLEKKLKEKDEDIKFYKMSSMIYKTYLVGADTNEKGEITERGKKEVSDLGDLLVEFGMEKGGEGAKPSLKGLGTGKLAKRADAPDEDRDETRDLLALMRDDTRFGKYLRLDPSTVKLVAVKEGREDKLGQPSYHNLLNLIREVDVPDLRTRLAAKQLEVDSAVELSKDLKKRADSIVRADIDALLKEREVKNANKTLDFTNEMKAIVKKNDEVKAEADTAMRKLQQVQKEKDDESARLNDELARLRAALKDRANEIATIRQQTEEAPKTLRSDWKILRLAPGGSTAYINLGLADNVAPQLTFSIHGVGPDGKPEQAPKGSLEVINPQPGHISEARITFTKDRQRTPVLEGDVLFNPTWSPTLKKHVAVVGIVDLSGEGRSSMDEFVDYLQRHNVIVDCFLDLNDLTVKVKRDGKKVPIDMKDGITVQTEYLIIGPGRAVIAQGLDQGDYGKRLDEQIQLMSAQAKEKGVPVIGLPRYLDNIGYRLPTGSNVGASNYRFIPPAAPPAPPAEKKLQ